jgi:hypothetical protein
VATFTKHPELGEMTFQRVDAPFAIANGRMENVVVLPFQQGAFVVTGEAVLPTGKIDYKMGVRNPTGIKLFGDDLAEYLNGGYPLMGITGTIDGPKPRIPTESIMEFALKRKLFGKDKTKKDLTPADPKKKHSKDILKDLLEGALKNK